MRSICPIFFLILIGCTGCTGLRDGRNTPTASEINTRKAEAHALIRARQYQGAIDILLPLAANEVKDSQLYSMLGESHWKLRAYDQAVAYCEQALRLDYSDPHTHLIFGEMLMEMGKVGRALTEFELAVRFDEYDALSHYNYGLALYEFGRKKEALTHWGIAFELDPRDARYAEALGIGYTGSDDEKAMEYFERASELGATSRTFHNNFGVLLVRLAKYDRATVEFEAALATDPDNVEHQLNLAVAHLKGGHYKDAIPILEGLVEESAEDRTPRIYLSRAYYEEGRFDDVIGLLEGWLEEVAARGGTATPGMPGLGEAYDILAMSFRGVGRLDRATAYMARALEIEPANANHLNNYGVILAESGRIEEAKAQWHKVLRLEPNNAVARQNLSAFDG